MKFFGKNKSEYSESAILAITDADRAWIDESVAILMQVPEILFPAQVEFNARFFPQTHEREKFDSNVFINDLQNMYSPRRFDISVDIFKDESKINIIPHATSTFGMEFYTEHIELDKVYRIHVSERAFENEFRLRAILCQEYIRILLGFSIEAAAEEQTYSDNLFIRVAMVIYGLGLFINETQNIIDTRVQAWVKTTHYYEQLIPAEWLAYTLGIFAYLTNDTEVKWLPHFNREIQIEFSRVMKFLSNSWPAEIPMVQASSDPKIWNKIEEAALLSSQGKRDKAISILVQLIPQIQDKYTKGLAYNNLGYDRFSSGDIAGSIPDFLEAIKFDPANAYAYDNVGFSYILMGELEKGNEYIEQAMNTEGNDMAYSFRNMAVYHQRLGDLTTSLEYFKKAYAKKSRVDYLHYFYGKFLIEYGEAELGKKYLRKEGEIPSFEME